MFPPLLLEEGIPSAVLVKTTAAFALATVLVTGAAAAAVSLEVSPDRAAVGETITIAVPPGEVSLESLERAGAPVLLGRVGPGAPLVVKVPDVPRGHYRVVLAGSREAPVFEVVALGKETSIALVVFGFLFVLALVVAGVVVHRRWRDAIS